MHAFTRTLFIAMLAWLPVCPAWAASRVSASYQIIVETQDFAGEQVASAAYLMQASSGGMDAVTSVGGDLIHQGLAGQWVNYVQLAVRSELESVAEGSVRQLAATLTFDDGTISALPARELDWAVESGPAASISVDGLLRARSVASDSMASARGSFGGLTAVLDIVVVNVSNDDLEPYANDGLDDAWQLLHFGPRGLDAGPGQDPDQDGMSNLFEFTAGLDPNSAAIAFQMRTVRDPAHPASPDIVFGPIAPNVAYTVEFSPSLGPEANWQPLDDSIVAEDAGQRTVTDLSASSDTRFYRIRLERAPPLPR